MVDPRHSERILENRQPSTGSMLASPGHTPPATRAGHGRRPCRRDGGIPPETWDFPLNKVRWPSESGRKKLNTNEMSTMGMQEKYDKISATCRLHSVKSCFVFHWGFGLLVGCDKWPKKWLKENKLARVVTHMWFCPFTLFSSAVISLGIDYQNIFLMPSREKESYLSTQRQNILLKSFQGTRYK